MVESFEQHLRNRMGNLYEEVSKKSVVDLEKEVVTFYLWNISGQLKGFQRYNWKGSKKNGNCFDGKYFSAAKSGPALFGLEYFDKSCPVTYVCEGVFDAISLMQFGNAVAVLTNNPKPLKEQLMLLPGRKVVVCDCDKAGMKLAKFGDQSILCEEGEDPNSMGYDKLKKLLGR